MLPSCGAKIFPFFFFFFRNRDSEDAVYGRDGYDYDGYRLRVEFPRSGRGGGAGGGGGGGGAGGGMGPQRSRYGPPSRRSEYRVVVTGRYSDLDFMCNLFPICWGLAALQLIHLLNN